jgi:CDP-glycerol glycerophosphotransferase (TagB/SpsB family)/glycosyltransferase involved in cell wall biosynthesis
MSDPKISVVVPFYNSAADLADCLSSIAAQTVTALEVIMVDDGSTDDGAAVAAAMAAADPRFTLIQVPNAGPGAARNTGMAAATGEYLAFVDSDDMLPPGAYERLLAVLERSGSDFVSGAVRRLSAAGLGESGLHDRAIRARRIGTHVSRTPELFYDISVWNKLFRRSFWERTGLVFPEGMLWEDLVAMTRAHVLAQAVDVITDPVYYWRDRDADAPSITQSRTRIGNFRDRITAFGMIEDFLRERGTPAMLAAHQHKALLNDLWLYVRDLSLTSEEYRREFVPLAAGYLRAVDPKVRADLPAARKLAYYLIERERMAELTEYAGWLARHPARTPPMVRTGRGLRADLPFRRDRALAIPDRVFRPQWRELDPHVGVDALGWRGGSLVIDGWAYLPSVDVGDRRQTTKLVLLVPRSRRRPPLVLPARSVRRPDVTAASGQDRYRYDWSGFRCVVSPRWFRAGRRWLTGEWDCFVLVRGRRSWRPARLHSPAPAADRPVYRAVAPGLVFGARWVGRRLRIGVRPADDAAAAPAGEPAGATAAPAAVVAGGPGPVLTGQAWGADGRLILRGRAAGPAPARITLRHIGGWERHEFVVTGAGPEFTAVIDVGAVETFGRIAPLRDGQWEIGVVAAPDTAAPDTAAPEPRRVAVDGRPVRAGRKTFRCSAEGGRLLLRVGPYLRGYERGRIRRKLLREVYYPVARRLPLRDQILLISYAGKQTGDNPRGIADELRRRGDRRRQIWAIADWSVTVADGADAVLIGSAAYFTALGRSRYLISNDHMPAPMRRRGGQRYTQTWHGTPLKRLGYDIARPSFASGQRYYAFMDHDVAQWDLLLSPDPFATPILRRAFRFGGEIAETGYPRNDALLASASGPAGAGDDRERIRRLIGVPPGRRVALYVPTWRDDTRDASGGYRLDFRIDLTAAGRRLAGDYVLAIRGHHLMAGGIPAARDGFTLDVTGYPDINDLLAIADVLITDYSSVMFDFAPTGRPMLFFTYDLERYRDQVRGFYFDFEAAAPGPLLRSSEEVVEALADIDAVAERYRDARAEFTARFCPLDDGKASARACDQIFGG